MSLSSSFLPNYYSFHNFNLQTNITPHPDQEHRSEKGKETKRTYYERRQQIEAEEEMVVTAAAD